MSEIFEALKKAQRQADERSRAAESPAAAGNGSAPAPVPVVAADPEPRRAAAPVAAVAPRRWSWSKRNGKAPAASDLLVTADDRTHVSEQFRLLRTRVELAGPGLYMLTSALDQEGKTLCAANLAVALSMGMESRVLVIDADLRHPSIGSDFGAGGRQGLVDCLTGTAQWRDCITSTSYRGLSILPAGHRSSLAPELLGSHRMAETIGELRQEFPDHFLIVDAPPLLLTSDPLVLARHMDHILLVVRADVTPRAAVIKAVETLGPERIFGVVFNGAQENLSHRYYYGGRYPYAGG